MCSLKKMNQAYMRFILSLLGQQVAPKFFYFFRTSLLS
jgi:hypothetical protein